MTGTLEESKALLVRRWGEMGGYWGINRTMAEIHALLFVSTEPLCTDDIMAKLHVSRGNASMNLRGLVDWGLIERIHKLGDRKEYFQADTDVWHMFETIMRERRRREVEPIVATINRCREMAAAVSRNGTAADQAEHAAEYGRRLDELQHFLNTMSGLFELVVRRRDDLRRILPLFGSPDDETPDDETPDDEAPVENGRRDRTTGRAPARKVGR